VLEPKTQPPNKEPKPPSGKPPHYLMDPNYVAALREARPSLGHPIAQSWAHPIPEPPKPRPRSRSPRKR
jgi:hypothetical protein